LSSSSVNTLLILIPLSMTFFCICRNATTFQTWLVEKFLCWALGDYHIRTNFWKFYLIRTGFTLDEPVSLVKVFRLFKLEPMFFGCSKCEHSRYMYNILSYWQGRRVCNALLREEVVVGFRMFSSCPLRTGKSLGGEHS
jgi:hypothetical protein